MADATATQPRTIVGCPAHPAPDPDCLDCLKKWGVSPDDPRRKSLLHPNALRARFLPGQSGNLKGRPPRQSMEQVIEDLLDEEIQLDPNLDPKTRRRIIGEIFLAMIVRADPKPWATRLLLDRVFPKRIEHDVNARGALTVIFDDQDRRLLESIEREEGDGDRED